MSFIEKEMDYFMFMQLKDLATTFMRKDVTIQYNQVSFLDIYTPKVTISSFWENRTSKSHHGEKSDLYLRALGNYQYSDRNALLTFLSKNKKLTLPSFSKQLVAFLEDIRLEELILKLRPGTQKAFDYRRSAYALFFRDQLKVNLSRGFKLDALFCFICLTLLDPSFYLKKQDLELPEDAILKIKENVFRIFEVADTVDVLAITYDVYYLIQHYFTRDMINMYFTLPKINDIPVTTQEEDESFDELMPSWTRKRKKETKETFLQFDDVDGEHQDTRFTETPRESEATDQVMAMVQGSSQQTDLNDHSEATTEQISQDEDGYNKGKENRYAIAIDKEIEPLKETDILAYDRVLQEIRFEKKRLVKLLSELLDKKREIHFRTLHYGKLGRKLTRFFTDDNPKLFSKKEEDETFDSSFTLLVDCSSSMMNKMEKAKESIALFHETLRQLNILHSVIGFWEDGMESDPTYQPNYFHEVISFTNSLQSNSGARIMQLQPEEDNRDGFAIRHAANKLAKQSERHKFLIVLTDGKPAAFDYFQNGVMDTKQAIQEARKLGIQTIGIQMDHQNEQQEKIMESMYNSNYLIVENLENMAGQFSALLRKVLGAWHHPNFVK